MLKVPQTIPTYWNVAFMRNMVKRSGTNVGKSAMFKVPQTVPTFRNVICIRNAVKRSENNVKFNNTGLFRQILDCACLNIWCKSVIAKLRIIGNIGRI